jgi:hypothetical protein
MTRRPDSEMLLELVPTDGSSIGNVTLLDQLGWAEEKYWRVREQLLESGVLERGKGKGGSVRRSNQSAQTSVTKALRNAPEAGLYQPLLTVLSNQWIREMVIEPDQIYFEMTAKQGKKLTGGTWTRPDITALSVRTFQHLPGKYVDVWTFEVKPAESLDVTAIFEAASHAGRATRSYALLQVPEHSTEAIEGLLDRCAREAARLRVGLITFVSESEFESWETRVEAPRLETAPEALDEFIGHLSDAAKKQMARWK